MASKPQSQREELEKIKTYLVNTLVRDLESAKVPLDQRQSYAAQRLSQILAKASLQLPEPLIRQLARDVLNEVIGYGPIQPLLDDPEISEVMVNGPEHVYVEKKGKVSRTDITFLNDDHVLQVIHRIVSPLGRVIDADHPAVDARLPDGSRVNAVIPPVAIDGPSITIRKFSRERLNVARMIEYGSLTREMADFLQACVVARLNILISGGTGSGKTTTLIRSDEHPPFDALQGRGLNQDPDRLFFDDVR
ncbi:MAG: Flp pilus assembly complex ATPase component TadA, partial [Chloroflexi bacterium]|nr:Flp pilus assembly complex ATPase component TadA [Chloroflexota bacterium]